MRRALEGCLWACLLAFPCRSEALAQHPIVGAIRWDAWTRGSEWELNLGPRQWRDRLPFYGRQVGEDAVEIDAARQEVMDQEIAYASAAGLDFWAYCFHLPWDLSSPPENYAVRLHLASQRKNDVHFCFILMAQGWWGPKDEYWRAAEALARYFADPAYQKVLGDRPLLFIYYVEQLIEYFGGEEQARRGLETIRDKAIAAGTGLPYIVAQVWNAETGARYVDQAGFDAIGAYAMIRFGDGNAEYPYAALAEGARRFWETCRATGKQVVPLVMAGWDHRPRWRDPRRFEEIYKSPARGPWYVQPTPQELAENVRNAIEWVDANPEAAPARTVLIYAWNESDEGGWLVPTHAEGTARLDAIARVLKRQTRP
ncbi:MAG: glycoside hydrolase family 99-like domain-containing protein [Armatimonadetes bacterium]|nr:glycoside hydrolase family 99-like domain-containing protein [Armatimonadota bacterium]